MLDKSRLRAATRWAPGAAGLSALIAVVVVPQYRWVVLSAILVLFSLLFGGYSLWQRIQARRQREKFSGALQAQTAATPRAISSPNQRAALDKLRQKFQAGLQEFKSRGKDIYKLPWYVIIGESGSGKSEAIRHSGIEFPPGLQDELQGSGGTVNMDWWFSNRGIILDTAGSMIFNEARAGETPEWQEFLRLLRRARPHCPINGLFMVLSVESLIRDSADIIAQKASRLAQQLQIIQRTLDVRFPVYLLVTKCDLLTGFREFFDSLEDPLLQHQIFGWSNPDPLDTRFRPELVEEPLRGVAGRLRQRRLGVLSAAAGRLGGDTQRFYAPSSKLASLTPSASRRLDEVDALFALPESLMRLAPRLRCYLERIFIEGEWSAKPVFLRGIYFTSSMREGPALDEAIAFATGLPLDQLPQDLGWERNRAFFLRDLFVEKVFREWGLVTRATNTLRMLRRRQLALFGTAGFLLLVFLLFAAFAYRNLKRNVLAEASYWQAGASVTNWSQGEWSSSVVRNGAVSNSYHFSDSQTNPVPGTDKLTLVQYHQRLAQVAEKPLAVNWVFKPMVWLGFGKVGRRPEAQRILFESSVLRPLVLGTRAKIAAPNVSLTAAPARARYQGALLALIELEADARAAIPNRGFIAETNFAAKYLTDFLTYLTDGEGNPDPKLVEAFAWTYSEAETKQNRGEWPPKSLLGGDSLLANSSIRLGLENFQKASLAAQQDVIRQLELLNELTGKLVVYYREEQEWRGERTDPCGLTRVLSPAQGDVERSWAKLQAASPASGPLTNLAARYAALQTIMSNASVSVLSRPIQDIMQRLPEAARTNGLFAEINGRVKALAAQAAEGVFGKQHPQLDLIPQLDANCVTPVPGRLQASYLWRWSLYNNACALMDVGFPVLLDSAQTWHLQKLTDLKKVLDGLEKELQAPAAECAKCPPLDLLRTNCQRYAKVVNSLVKEDGKAAEWDLLFVPPSGSTSKEDRDIISIYRYVQVSIGTETTGWEELSHLNTPTLILTNRPMDAGLRLSFRRLLNDSRITTALELPTWGLPALAREGKLRAAPSDNGTRWRIAIDLEDNTQFVGGKHPKGRAVFEAVVKRPLPDPSDWPRSR
jgi:hypothetical protein